jgi:DNA polymerase-1
MTLTLRSCIIAEQGHTLIVTDASQIELRVAALLSQDPVMIEDLKSKDLHMATAIRVFGWVDDPEEMTKRRYKAKTLNFAILYGADAFKISEMTGMSVEEAKAMQVQYFKTYCVLKAWMDRIQREAKENGYVTNLFGRLRPIPELQSTSLKIRARGERKAVNTVVQGTAVDIFKKIMLNLRATLDGRVHIILQVHDEIILECPDHLIPDTLAVIADLKSYFPEYPLSTEMGKCYGELEKVTV